MRASGGDHPDKSLIDRQPAVKVATRRHVGGVPTENGAGPAGPSPGRAALAQRQPRGRPGPGQVVHIADHQTSCHLAQGITALLVRKARTGIGGLVQTSLLEAMLDLQFELLSTHLNDASVTVQRGGQHSAHAFLPAPYGTYPTSDGYLALAMNPIDKVGALLEDPYLTGLTDPQAWWDAQAEIEELLAARFATRTTEEWLTLLDRADVWCAPVLTLEQLVEHDGFAAIAMTQPVGRDAAVTDDGADLRLQTTRSPIRIDGSG